MISPEYVRTMAAYNAEMNRRVYGAAARLDNTERRADRGLFWRSIHGTLSHILWGDRIWFSRFGLGTPPDAALTASNRTVEDFDALWAERETFDAEIAAFAETVSPAALTGDLTWYSGAAGREMTKPRAICMIQVFNHQTHHRGQVHAALTRAGESTGATDLPFVL